MTKAQITKLFAVLFTLNMIDASTTWYLISQFGIDVEVNPIMKYVIIQYGIFGMFLVKTLLVGIFYCIFKLSPDSASNAFRTGLFITCGVYTILCIHNIYAVFVVMQAVG